MSNSRDSQPDLTGGKAQIQTLAFAGTELEQNFLFNMQGTEATVLS